MLLIKKPDWIYYGTPPEPRIFELKKVGTVKTITSNDMMENLVFRNTTSADHCNTISEDVYDLVYLDSG